MTAPARTATVPERPPTAAEAFAAFETLERYRATLIAQAIAAAPQTEHYVNGRSPRLPAGWTVDRFLRWCRDRLQDGAVHVERDGKLRRVRVADLDGWIAAQSAKTSPLKLRLVDRDSKPANVDVDAEAAAELGLRPRRTSR